MDHWKGTEGVAKGEGDLATFRRYSAPTLASPSSSAVIEFVEPSRTPFGDVVRHVTGLMADTLLTTRYTVHTRYESMLHLDVIRTCLLSKFVRNSFVYLSPCDVAAALSLIDSEGLDKQNRTVDRNAHPPQAVRARSINLHARLAAKFT